jgi:hypothetical protein
LFGTSQRPASDLRHLYRDPVNGRRMPPGAGGDFDMSTSARTSSDSTTVTPRRSRPVGLGLSLLVLAFVPALLASRFPEVWGGLPDAARWAGYGLSALCVIGITLLILKADYHDYSTDPAGRDE